MSDCTLQDLLNKHNLKINEIILNLDNQKKLIEWLKEEGIKEEVIKQIQDYFLVNKIDGGIF